MKSRLGISLVAAIVVAAILSLLGFGALAVKPSVSLDQHQAKSVTKAKAKAPTKSTSSKEASASKPAASFEEAEDEDGIDSLEAYSPSAQAQMSPTELITLAAKTHHVPKPQGSTVMVGDWGQNYVGGIALHKVTFMQYHFKPSGEFVKDGRNLNDPIKDEGVYRLDGDTLTLAFTHTWANGKRVASELQVLKMKLEQTADGQKTFLDVTTHFTKGFTEDRYEQPAPVDTNKLQQVAGQFVLYTENGNSVELSTGGTSDDGKPNVCISVWGFPKNDATKAKWLEKAKQRLTENGISPSGVHFWFDFPWERGGG